MTIVRAYPFFATALLALSIKSNRQHRADKPRFAAAHLLLDHSSFIVNKSHSQLIRCSLTAFKIANKATPTSANTASHMVAMPNAPSISTRILTPKAR